MYYIHILFILLEKLAMILQPAFFPAFTLDPVSKGSMSMCFKLNV